jgi:hypothetical protein
VSKVLIHVYQFTSIPKFRQYVANHNVMFHFVGVTHTFHTVLYCSLIFNELKRSEISFFFLHIHMQTLLISVAECDIITTYVF